MGISFWYIDILLHVKDVLVDESNISLINHPLQMIHSSFTIWHNQGQISIPFIYIPWKGSYKEKQNEADWWTIEQKVTFLVIGYGSDHLAFASVSLRSYTGHHVHFGYTYVLFVRWYCTTDAWPARINSELCLFLVIVTYVKYRFIITFVILYEFELKQWQPLSGPEETVFISV